GWNHSSQPITSENVLFNVLAPGVIENHVTLGATYAMSRDLALSFDYVHAFNQTITGTGASQGTQIGMSQNTVGFSLGWKY
ncbi:MAG: hypothetical protein ACYCZI_10590, partial [Metallibacterium scheffleri]